MTTTNSCRYIFLWPSDREAYKPNHAGGNGPVAPGIYSRPPFVPGSSGGIWPIVIQCPATLAQRIYDDLQPLVNEHFAEASPVNLSTAFRNSATFQEVSSLFASLGTTFWAVLAAKTVCLFIDERTAHEAWVAPCGLMFKKMSTHHSWIGAFFAMVSKGQEPHLDLISHGFSSSSSRQLTVPTAVPHSPPGLPPRPIVAASPSLKKRSAQVDSSHQSISLSIIPGTPSRTVRCPGSVSPSKPPMRLINTPPLHAIPSDIGGSSSRTNVLNQAGRSSPSPETGSPVADDDAGHGPFRLLLRAARAIGTDPGSLSHIALDYLSSHGYENHSKRTLLSAMAISNTEQDFIANLRVSLPGTPTDEAGFIYRMLLYRY